MTTILSDTELGQAVAREITAMRNELDQIKEYLDEAGIQAEDDGRPLPLSTRAWYACQAYADSVRRGWE